MNNAYLEKLNKYRNDLETNLARYIKVYEGYFNDENNKYDSSKDPYIIAEKNFIKEIDKEIINANKVKSKFDIKAEKIMKILDIIADPVTIFDEPETESDEESRQNGFLNKVRIHVSLSKDKLEDAFFLNVHSAILYN
jgi:hypothetical protein